MKDSHIDLLIRIKNGYMANNESIMTRYSKFKEEILKVLKKLKYIEDYSVNKKTKPSIKVKLAYDNNESLITDIKIFSKPGRKYYIKSSDLKSNRLSIVSKILTTSSGVMTEVDAKKKKLGGELLFEIW